MTNNATPAFVTGLAELAPAYRALLCDVWGVVHNGVARLSRRRRCAGPLPRRRRHRAAHHQCAAPQGAASSPCSTASACRAMPMTTSSPPASRRATSSPARPARASTISARSATCRSMTACRSSSATSNGCEIVSCTGLFDDETETPDDYQDAPCRLAGARRADDLRQSRHRRRARRQAGVVRRRARRALSRARRRDDHDRQAACADLRDGAGADRRHRRRSRWRRNRCSPSATPWRPTSAARSGRGSTCCSSPAASMPTISATRDAPDLAKVHERLATAGLAARAVMPRLVWERRP